MPKTRAFWSALLTRSLTLKSGDKLVTLADARDCLIKYFETVVQNNAALARAIELLFKAAETGSFVDRKAATDQIAIVLRGRVSVQETIAR
jgi:hypothetical protein